MTVANTLDTLQSLVALDAQNTLALHQNNLTLVATALVDKMNADKSELSAKQIADNVIALNLITNLQSKVNEALVKAEVLGSAEFAQIEATIKSVIESNPTLVAIGAGAVELGGDNYAVSSAVRSLILAPKAIEYVNLFDANHNVVGAKILTQDGLQHIFNASEIVADGIKTVSFLNESYYNSEASFVCVFEEVLQNPIVAGNLTINLGNKWIAKSHTNIQIHLADLVAYVPPETFITPDLNNDGVIGVAAPQ